LTFGEQDHTRIEPVRLTLKKYIPRDAGSQYFSAGCDGDLSGV
jgi:hypothetical protein